MVPAVMLVIIGVVVGFLVLGGDSLLGLDSGDTNTIVSLIPGIVVLFVSFFAVSKSRGYLLSGAVAGVGLSFAFLLSLMNDAGLIVNDLEISITDLQVLVIVVFLILGVGLAVRDR